MRLPTDGSLAHDGTSPHLNVPSRRVPAVRDTATASTGRVGAAFHRGPRSSSACADDAAALLEHLGIRRAIVAGYSMGGPIAMLTWQRHPELVAGLVLGATALEWRATLRERFVWRFLSVLEVSLRLGTADR